MFQNILILVDILSTIGTLASILWLFLLPSIEPFVTSVTCLSITLGTSIQARIKIYKLQDESLSNRIHSIKEFRKIIDNIPNITENELILQLKENEDFRRSLTSRLCRLFGLRHELIPYIEPELISIIDTDFESFYNRQIGECNFNEDKINKFAASCIKILEIVKILEAKFVSKYKKGRR